jgi:hypothetical protein
VGIIQYPKSVAQVVALHIFLLIGHDSGEYVYNIVTICETLFAHPRKPMTHLQFRTQLYEALLKNWEGWGATTVPPPIAGTGVCFPVQSSLQNPCVVCNDGTLSLIRPH